MPRPLRPIDDGLIYHVINRGNNRQKVFHKPADFVAFLHALAELKEESRLSCTATACWITTSTCSFAPGERRLAALCRA
jgi:hypothetical protein